MEICKLHVCHIKIKICLSHKNKKEGEIVSKLSINIIYCKWSRTKFLETKVLNQVAAKDILSYNSCRLLKRLAFNQQRIKKKKALSPVIIRVYTANEDDDEDDGWSSSLTARYQKSNECDRLLLYGGYITCACRCLFSSHLICIVPQQQRLLLEAPYKNFSADNCSAKGVKASLRCKSSNWLHITCVYTFVNILSRYTYSGRFSTPHVAVELIYHCYYYNICMRELFYVYVATRVVH